MARRIVLALALAALALPAARPARAQVEGPPPDFFARHRQAFMDRMQGGIAIFAAAPEVARNDDAGYPYRQDSDFWYLTGFEEPEAVAVLRPDAPAGERYVLFVRPRDLAREVWTGARAGVEGAKERYGADRAWEIDSVDSVLARLLDGVKTVYWDYDQDHDWAHAAMREELEAWVAADSTRARTLEAAGDITSELRLVKGPREVEYLQKAIDVTSDAHRAAMSVIAPGMYEYQVEALIEYVFRESGSPRVGFESIVGSGPNATTLHYEENQRRMEAGDMVVMDIGAEWDYYSADVTRTVPVDGTFSPEQRAIYQVVLDAQQAGIDAIEPGAPASQVHSAAARVVTEGLVRLGLLSGTVEENLRSGGYRRFFMHGTSHWLGLDVHDVGVYAEPGQKATPRRLRPGMVLTVEPGIYVPRGAEGVDPKWWNIGVRIEDDVLVTETGHRVLSTSPKRIDEIEAIMQRRPLPDPVPRGAP